MENSPVTCEDFSPSLLAEIRLIATDMDGTLTDQGQFTSSLIQTLETLATAGISTLIVTGRSAGWVQGIVAYLPIVGAIAENGGVFIPKSTLEPVWLVKIPEITDHRTRLAAMFTQIQATFPQLHPASDNRFRLTDWTCDLDGLSPADVQTLSHLCQAAGWGFTYSTVQCHIRLATQDKGTGLKTLLQQFFPQISPQQVVTVGDSPNDEGLFDPELFPISVGVANVQHYQDRLRYLPVWTTQAEEIHGFQELVQAIFAARQFG